MKLSPTDFWRVRDLFAPLDDSLAVASILAGMTPAPVYVDERLQPQVAFTAYKNRWFLAGSPQPADVTALQKIIHEQVLPQAQAAGQEAGLVHATEAWIPALDTVLSGLYPLKRMRQYFECTQIKEDWRELLPPGFELWPVDAGLLARTGIRHLDALREEMRSERSSVQAFLEKSFGFCLTHEDEIVSWCLSEYNLDGRCEVGVATVEAYQRRGLATVTSLALVEYALAHGYQRIGWHCWQRNEASAALARRAGFEYVMDYPVSLCVFNPAVQMALHGEERRLAGQEQAALDWYQRACQQDDPPAWVRYNAACLLAQRGMRTQAFERLRQALTGGFDASHARRDPDLESLYSDPAWDALFD